MLDGGGFIPDGVHELGGVEDVLAGHVDIDSRLGDPVLDHALKHVVQQHGAMTAERAVDYVNSLAQAQRYVRDVY